MKRLLIAAALTLALPACNLQNPPTSPGQVANHTVADDIAMRAVEQLYGVSTHLLEMAADTKAIKGADAVKADQLQTKLDQGVAVARTAYRAFNSTGLVEAYNNVILLSGQAMTITGRNQ